MITIDPPIEKLTNAQKIELIDQLEASLSDDLPAEWTPPQSHLDLLAERDELERSGQMEVLDLEEFERRLMEAKL